MLKRCHAHKSIKVLLLSIIEEWDDCAEFAQSTPEWRAKGMTKRRRDMYPLGRLLLLYSFLERTKKSRIFGSLEAEESK